MNHESEKPVAQDGCSTFTYQDVNVCVPVTLKPFGNIGNVKAQCLGTPVISSKCDSCEGKPNGICKFTISQTLRVEIPVNFGARAEIGEISVDCGCLKSVNVDNSYYKMESQSNEETVQSI